MRNVDRSNPNDGVVAPELNGLRSRSEHLEALLGFDLASWLVWWSSSISLASFYGDQPVV